MNRDSKYASMPLCGDIEVDIKNILSAIEETVREAYVDIEELGTRYASLRAVLQFTEGGNQAKNNEARLKKLIARWKQSMPMATLYGEAEYLEGSTQTMLNFDDDIYLHHGRDIYLTAKEKLFLFEVLISRKLGDSPLEPAHAQVLYRLRKRLGADFIKNRV